MRHTVSLLLFAQLSLFFGLFVCVLLIPHFLFEANEGGVSNYGIYAKTIVPYTLGFGICAFLTLRAACTVPKTAPDRKVLYPVLAILGVLYFLALVSTYSYKLNDAYDHLHQFASAALVIYSVGTGTWLAVFKSRRTTTLLLFFAQIIGFLLALATRFGFLHTLFIAEILESMAFGALLVVGIARLPNAPATRH